MGSRLQQDLLSLSTRHSLSKLGFIKKTQFIVQCVCVCVLGGNAINPEIMNHLESGVGAHFDQILGRFHKMAGPCQGVSGRLNSARIGLKLAL